MFRVFIYLNLCCFSTSEQLFKDFDMSEMAFNPAVNPPQKHEIKDKKQKHLFADSLFEDECKTIIKAQLKCKGNLLCR